MTDTDIAAPLMAKDAPKWETPQDGQERRSILPCGCHFNVTTNTQVFCSYEHYIEG